MDSANVSGNEKPEVRGEEFIEAVDIAINSLKDQIKTPAGVKGTISDLIRLLQLRKELAGERKQKIKARWVEECSNSNGE